jgi:hypothetical protein
MKRTPLIFIALTILTACSGESNVVPATATINLAISTFGVPTSISITPTAIPIKPQNTQAPTPTLPMGDWKSLPIVPNVSADMVAVYKRGLARGRDPSRFSKIGDCQNITTYFLAEFDNPKEYSLGSSYAYLQPTIDHFAGSWSRESIAVHGGMNVAAVQSPFWDLTARPAECQSGESPLVCEIRVNNPSITIISMEESWSGDIVKYDKYLRMIVEYTLSQDVVPILATRAEPINTAISINATVARIAYDYHLPLWNFWAAANPLPNNGLTPDRFHLTWAAPYFDDPQRMLNGWPWRNLTALQAIDAVWRGVSTGH